LLIVGDFRSEASSRRIQQRDICSSPAAHEERRKGIENQSTGSNDDETMNWESINWI